MQAGHELFLRERQVLARVPVVRSTLWRWIQEGTFPRPCKLGRGTSAWRLTDLESWIASRTPSVASEAKGRVP